MTSVAPPENLLPISQFASRKDPRSDDEILNTTPLLSIHDAMITAAKSHRARESPSAGLMRPDPLHIPGSYRSEVSDQTIQETAEEAGLAEHKSAPDDPPHIETLEADEYDGNINVSGQEEPEVAHNAQHSPLAIHRNPDISSFHSRLDTPEQLEWEVEHEHSSVKPNVMLPAIKSSGLDAAATSPEALEWLHDHATSTAPPERSRVSPSLSSFRSQKGPVSLASGTSRTAAYRHALLKPRVGSTGPLDMGLPIQPLLTTKDELGGISAVDDKRHNSLPASKKIALSDLAIAANAPTALERLKEQAVQNTGYDTRLPSRRRESSVKGVRPKNALLARKSEQETPEVSNAEEPLRDDQGYTNDLPPSKLTADQAAYWGISPLIRGAVQSAVHDGVRKAVREIKLVTGIQHDTTTGVYERLIADSLAEASNEAEDHLRRNSIWDRLSSPSVDKLSSSHTQTSLITNHSSENATISTSVVYRRNGRQVDSGVPKRATTTTNLPLAEHKLSDVAGSSIEQASLSEKPKPVQEAVKLDSIAAPAMQPQTEPKVTETVPFIDRNKTLLWLKDLLTHSTEPNRPDFEAGKVPGRSQPEAAEPPEEEIVKIERTLSDSKIMKRTPARTQTFTKTIEDLEVLLNEAVSIANDATALEGVNALPALFANASTVSKSHGYSEDVPVYTGSGTRSNTIRQSRADTKSRSTDHVSMHESMRDSSDDSSSASDANLVTGTHEDHSMIDTSALSIGEEGEDGRSKIRTWPVIRFKDPLPSPGLLRAMTSHAPMAGYDTAESPIPLKSTLNDSKIVSSDQTPETLAPSRGDMDQYDSKTNVPPPTKLTIASKQPYIEDTPAHISQSKPINLLPNKREVREYIRVFHHPPIQVRDSSKGRADRVTGTRPAPDNAQSTALDCATAPRDADCSTINSIRSLDRESGDSVLMDFSTPQGFRKHAGVRRRTEAKDTTGNGIELQDIQSGDHKIPDRHASGRALLSKSHQYLSLRGKHHVDIGHHKGFSLSHSHKRQPIARDWSSARKRFTAAIACISTSLVGILVGIYAGEVPSIQYYIADFHHYAILGNVFFYIGLAIPTFLAWPLPLMHGRKPYILSSMTIAMPLLFPQAIAVQVQRSPYTDAYRVCLILPRAFMGLALGLAQMNFMAILLDLFGASLMSSNPHQEVVDRYDVRRHGGGFGLWLGIWTWSYVGSIGFGFWIGAWIINSQSPDWGFYVSIIIIAVVLLLNVLAPEVRRSVYRRSVAEVREGADIKRRLARGEVMMHRVQTGPKWWGQELQHGVLLSLDMLRQPGFLVLAFYTAWTYAQIILLIVLLGSLTSKYYRFTSPLVGVTTLCIPIGALLAVPFSNASLFSRARHHPQRTDSMTFEKRFTWSSHLVRRAVFTLTLPFAGLAYCLSSGGPPTPFILPILFAALVAFLSALAIAECNGLIMETFDTSDLQPGMTGRPRGGAQDGTQYKRTNYSSFPRIASAFSICQGLGFLLAAAATGVGGAIERSVGARAAVGVMAAILLFLTLLLLAILLRWKEEQIIPTSKTGDMERWEMERKASVARYNARSQSWNTKAVIDPQQKPVNEEIWRPVIIGNPSGKTRRMSVLELGSLSRWSEIRKKNRLIDTGGYEAAHPNLAVLETARDRIHDSRGSVQRKKEILAKGGPIARSVREVTTTEEGGNLPLPEVGEEAKVELERMRSQRAGKPVQPREF